MAKLLLINPSYYRTYGSTAGGLANPVYPVMSLAAVGGAARRAGHDVKILDMSYQRYDPNFVRSEILKAKPDVVGITATTPLANQMSDISYIVKDISKDIVTVGGGPHATALMQETLEQSLLDMAAFGEGDDAIVDIMGGIRPSEIGGVIWRDGERMVTNPSRPMIEDLDDLAIPAWDLFPVEVYKKYITRIMAKRSPVSMIEFSRGCVYKCDFCASKNTVGFGYRKKSPERCAEEMLHLQKLGYREVVLADDIFTSDNNWAVAVCEEFIRRGVKMTWTCSNGIRVDSANDELFRIMKRAGCYRVHFGFESGNDEVLTQFGKGGKATLSQGIEAVDMARSAGLQTFGMFMLGLSSDNEKTMQDTIDYGKHVRVDAMRFGITVPFPGTKMFDDLHRSGHIKSYDWDMYTVYNDAHQIYEHPNLDWKLISRYFKKSHVEALLLNPGYILRRFLSGLKSMELFWDAYYFFKFLKLMRASQPEDNQQDEYAYRHIWGGKSVGRPNIGYIEPVPIRGVSRKHGKKAPVLTEGGTG
jgi:anaerobic magnesium-protoporphyrin IX monomethyl ester cyclase